MHILASGFGALLIFALLGLYYKIQRRSEDDSRHMDLYRFVASKKASSLLLLGSFISIVITSYSIHYTKLYELVIAKPDFIPGAADSLYLDASVMILAFLQLVV